MHFAFTDRCARTSRVAAVLGLALIALHLVNPSICYATTLSHGSYSIDIEVIDYAGPVEVSDQYTGVASNGLPTIEIYEKFYQTGNEQRYWSDVELRVKVRPYDNGGGSGDGSGSDNPITSIFDNIHNIFDDINNVFNWGNQGEDDCDSGGADPNGWQEDVVIGIDKFVKNRTDNDWDRFRIVLGTGIGNQFVPSDSLDSLYIVSDPMAKETANFYNEPPQRDFPDSDYLQWNADGNSHTGQGYRDRAGFWFGINVPQEMFVLDPNGCDFTAQFTLRQHTGTGVPEPTTLVLLMAGTVIGSLRRKTCRKTRRENRLR
jgi:hypothetical protein